MKRFFVIGLILLLSTVLAGCSRRTAAPIAVPAHDTLRMTEVRHDSVWVDRWHEVVTKGDTVFDTRTEYVYREKTVHDTTIQTIEVPYEVTVKEYVEKELSGGQRFLIRAGWIFVAAFFLGLLYLAFRLWQKK